MHVKHTRVRRVFAHLLGNCTKSLRSIWLTVEKTVQHARQVTRDDIRAKTALSRLDVYVQ